MKKLIYLGIMILSANSFANSYWGIRGSVNYTHLTMPKITVAKGITPTSEHKETIREI